MSRAAPQIPCLAVGATENGKVSFDAVLDSGEALTGTPTITEQTTSDLTLSNKAVSTGNLTILGETVTTGRAVTFTCSGQQAGVTYRLIISCGTDSTPAQTKVLDIYFTGE